MMYGLLEKLCSIGGVSGREDKVREFIISEIDGFADWRVDPLGNLIRPNYISERFPKMLKKNGLPRIRFHDLRHSCASMLIAHKAGMKQVQMWMGHSSITTTMDTYGHLDDSAKVELGETMASLLLSLIHI